MTALDRNVPLHPLAGVFGDATTAGFFSEAALIESWLEVERALAAAQGESLGSFLRLLPQRSAKRPP